MIVSFYLEISRFLIDSLSNFHWNLGVCVKNLKKFHCEKKVLFKKEYKIYLKLLNKINLDIKI